MEDGLAERVTVGIGVAGVVGVVGVEVQELVVKVIV